MKIQGLDGKIHHIDVRETLHGLKSKEKSKSKLQYNCGQILKSRYPFDIILEEIAIPSHGLFLDFLIPARKIVVEVHGRQHDKYVPFFHHRKENFILAQKRDQQKKELCLLNNLRFIEVRSEKELQKLLNQN